MVKTNLAYYLFEADAGLEEAMGISTGGAGLASSGEISGGPMLPLGMKPGDKLKNRKQTKHHGLISASPAVHDPKALTNQSESFGAMHEPDFKGETMPGLWKGLAKPEEKGKTLVVIDDFPKGKKH